MTQIMAGFTLETFLGDDMANTVMTQAEVAAYLRGERQLPPVAPATPAAPKPSKYRNQPVEIDGIRFASKREAKRYVQLKALRQGFAVKWFIRQVPFHLPGGVKYVADFLVVWEDGRITVEDAKGVRTPVYAMKAKQVKELYGVEIVEV